MTGTANHPLLVLERAGDGRPLLRWRTLAELRPGARVAVSRAVVDDRRDPAAEALGALLGAAGRRRVPRGGGRRAAGGGVAPRDRRQAGLPARAVRGAGRVRLGRARGPGGAAGPHARAGPRRPRAADRGRGRRAARARRSALGAARGGRHAARRPGVRPRGGVRGGPRPRAAAGHRAPQPSSARRRLAALLPDGARAARSDGRRPRPRSRWTPRRHWRRARRGLDYATVEADRARRRAARLLHPRRHGRARLRRQRARQPQHRGAADGGGVGVARRPAPRGRRVPAQLHREARRAVGAARRLPEPAGERLQGHRLVDGLRGAAAQPGRGLRGGDPAGRGARRAARGAARAPAGPRLPHRRHRRQPRGAGRGLRDAARAPSGCRRGSTWSSCRATSRPSSSPSCPTACRPTRSSPRS